MKRIILSEGKNDTIFLEELMTERTHLDKQKILFFDQDSGARAKDLKFFQDRYFDKLQSEWLHYELLAKSEGGKTKIIGVTISKLCYLCEQGCDPIMLIDLDGSPITCFADELWEKLNNRFKCYNLSKQLGKLLETVEAQMLPIKLFKNSRLIGTIYMIGFRQTLEKATGIKNGVHSDKEKQSIAKAYLKNSSLPGLFLKALQIE